MLTIPELLLNRFADSAEHSAIFIKREGQFQSLTWGELQRDVRKYIACFQHRGVASGDVVAQFSENRYEWILTDLALHLIGAIHVPIHATLSGKQVLEQITHSRAKLLLVSNRELLAKLDSCSLSSPENDCVLFEDFADESVDVTSAIASEATVGSRVTPESVATILYTSGTTGEPKGVMLTQRNLASNAVNVNLGLQQHETDLRLNFLPLSHIFARTCDLYSWIARGSQLALAESRETIVSDAQTIRPTIINGVPYFFSHLRRTLESLGVADKPGAIKELLGGRLRLCCSGGAAMSCELFDYFQLQGTPLLQGYGLTESSPVISVSSLDVNRRGSVGKAIEGVEVTIADDGEVLTKGSHVMLGYFRNEAATKAVLKDGWLHTGDLGRIDKDGFLYITGRKKELIVTATGKNISPSYLEALLGEDTFIAQALVIGNDRRFLSALIVPDLAAVKKQMEWNVVDLDGSKLRDFLAERIHARLSDCGKHEQIAKFAILAEPFSIEKGEMTAKLSLRRSVIEANYASKIEAIYA